METNKVELVGTVSFITEPKTTSGGGVIVTALLGKKKYNKEEYDSFRLKLFNDTAKKFINNVKKGDKVYILGRLSSDTYEKDGKKVTTIDVVVNDYNKVEYDANSKDYKVVGAAQQQELDDLFA
jgi:single-stranded DNA-binding protein